LFLTSDILEALLHSGSSQSLPEEKKQAEPTKGQGIRIRVPRRTFDLFRRLFCVAGVVPPDGGAKQLSQRGNAELFFRSGAVRLNGFQT
jgi:hypothetical protein